jgi:hypothetical protein
MMVLLTYLVEAFSGTPALLRQSQSDSYEADSQEFTDMVLVANS